MLVNQAKKWLKDNLSQSGLEEGEADFQARLLLAAMLQKPLSTLPLYGLTEADMSWLEPRLKRRLQGEPLQYILGETEFMGLTLRALPQALIPRGDSEIVVEKAIALLQQRAAGTEVESSALAAADICTGGGAFAIAMACYLPSLCVYAVDISADALALAKENCALNGVETRVKLIQGDLLLPIIDQKLRLPLIVANPPYIPTEEIADLNRELSYEPFLALDGGRDGLDFYRRLAAQAGEVLLPGGCLLLEHGAGQREDICRILQTEGYVIKECFDDYGHRDRGIAAVYQ